VAEPRQRHRPSTPAHQGPPETIPPQPVEAGSPAAGPGAEVAGPPDAGSIEAPLRAEVEELRDRWLRAEAELQNYRRRAARDLEEGRRAAEEAVLLEMVGVADDLERGLGAMTEADRAAPWAEGVGLVLRRIRDYLRRQGVEVVDPLGQPFDPDFHEALLGVDAAPGVAAGRVAEVALKGYRRGGRALRAARVVVTREPGTRSVTGDRGPADGQG
jgi:molecular chaperone GrpE